LCHRVFERIDIMATTERDTVYTNDGNRTVYTRESNGTGWLVGVIVVLALLAIGYLVFSANSGPSTTVDVNVPAAVETTAPAMAPAPMTEAPAPATEAAPMAPAAAAPAAPAANTTTDTTVAPPAAPAQ
jgi:cytoskeletal protein RodZ